MKLVRETNKGTTEIKCPWCGTWQEQREYKQYTIIPQFMACLTPILQCQHICEDNKECRHIFAPTALALKMRREMLEGMETQ